MYQILTNDDEVCIPSLSSILLAVTTKEKKCIIFQNDVLCDEMKSEFSSNACRIYKDTVPQYLIVSRKNDAVVTRDQGRLLRPAI